MGALEGAASLAHGKLVSFSEQNIIDCSGQLVSQNVKTDFSVCFFLPVVTYGNHGCKGGNMYYAYQYVLANEGVDTTKGYPYKGRVSSEYVTWKITSRKGGIVGTGETTKMGTLIEKGSVRVSGGLIGTSPV